MNTCLVAAEDFEMPEIDGNYGDPFGLKFGAGGLSLMEVEESPEVASLISISLIKNTSPSSILQLTPPALLESCQFTHLVIKLSHSRSIA